MRNLKPKTTELAFVKRKRVGGKRGQRALLRFLQEGTGEVGQAGSRPANSNPDAGRLWGDRDVVMNSGR